MTLEDKLDLSDEVLATYVDNEITPSQMEAVEHALAESPSARRRLVAMKQIAENLREDLVGLDSIDLVASVREQIAIPPPPSRSWHWLVPTVSAVAAVLVLLLVVRQEDGSIGEFRAKSNANQVSADTWVGIDIYLVGDEPTLLSQSFPPRAGLLFSYTNAEKSGFSYLMVFAVDESGKVYWFHPAYDDASTDPESISIGHSQTSAELSEVIRHEYPLGPIVFYGLFSDHPLKVSDVERQIAELVGTKRWSVLQPDRLPFPGTGQHMIRSEVANQ